MNKSTLEWRDTSAFAEKWTLYRKSKFDLAVFPMAEITLSDGLYKVWLTSTIYSDHKVSSGFIVVAGIGWNNIKNIVMALTLGCLDESKDGVDDE